MPINLGKAKSLTAGGESLVEKDLITDDAYVLIKHKQLDERGFDYRVNQSLQMETPQPVKTSQNTNSAWLINLPDDRRVTSITFEAWTGAPITDGVLVIRRAGEPFYSKFLGSIPDAVETTFDLTGAGFVPLDLIDATAYTMTIVSQSGVDIELIGDTPDLPFYKWEYHELTVEQLAYVSDTITSSVTQNGSFDATPCQITVVGATTFDTTTADFAFINDPITGDKVIKTYVGESGVDASNFEAMDFMGIQRNIYVYVDVAQTPPVLKLSLNIPGEQPPNFSYIGNFDLSQTTTPFDTLTDQTRIVHTAYSGPATGTKLHVSKQNYRLSGLILNGLTAATLDLGITAGSAIRIGANTVDDYKNPDIPPPNAEDFLPTLNRQYIDSSGDTITILETAPTLSVDEYAPGGVLTTVSPASRFQIIYLYVFPRSWAVRATLTGTIFSTIADAEMEVVRFPINQPPEIREAVLTTALIVAGNATDLQDVAQAKFIAL